MFHVIIFTFVVTLNCAYAGLFVWLLRRRRPRMKGLERALGVWAVFVIGMLIVTVIEPASWEPFMRQYLYFPMAVEMIWNALMVEGLVLLLIIATVIIRRARPVKSDEETTPAAISRRRFLYLCSGGAAPAAAMVMGVHGTVTRHDLRVNKMLVPVPNLPPELEGFTIAHVSDLHSGLFCGPKRLKIIHDATNDLNADLVAITGDVINQQMEEFPDALQAMQNLRSRYGTFVCEGNHDIIPGHGLVMRACKDNRLNVLYNSCIAVPIAGRRLLLGGLPWVRHGYDEKTNVAALFPSRRDGDVRILFAHHPNLFDIAQSADLVLSGHTHGGQIMLTDEVGLGPLFFRYWSGLYRNKTTSMVVSNGAGDWFPCRVGAPAEIGLLRLTRA